MSIGTPGRDQNFNQKAANLQAFSDRASKTSRMVAAGGLGGNKKLAEVLLASANQIDSLTPQLISAGRIRMNYPENKAAEEHLNNLRDQYMDTILRLRTLCDQATDPADFIKASEEAMQKHTILCEDAIRNGQPQKMVDNTSSIARLANRVLLVAKQEADNSEDPDLIQRINGASNSLQNAVPPMVHDAKVVATNIHDPGAAHNWRDSNKKILDSVRKVRNAVAPPPVIPAPPTLKNLSLNDSVPPPRPPLPQSYIPARPPPPETDDEDERLFRSGGPVGANQPILVSQKCHHYNSNNKTGFVFRLPLVVFTKRCANGRLRTTKLLRQPNEWPFLWLVSQSLWLKIQREASEN